MEVRELERKVKELTLANWDLENSLNNLDGRIETIVTELQSLNNILDGIQSQISETQR